LALPFSFTVNSNVTLFTNPSGEADLYGLAYQNGKLYGVSRSGFLYTIDATGPNAGVATQIAQIMYNGSPLIPSGSGTVIYGRL
jgi:hypothetical protein